MIDCTFEKGNKAFPGLRHVTVGVLAVNREGEILLVRRSSKLNTGASKISVPGGFLGRDENTAQAALRELKEETGFEGTIQALFQINDNSRRPKEDRQNVDFIYLVKLGEKGTIGTPDEVRESLWFSKANLPPDEDFAFDHRNIILKYFEYLRKPFELPMVGSVEI